MIHGDLTDATQAFQLREGTLIVSEAVDLEDPRYLWRVAVSADAIAAAGDVPLRGAVYTAAGVLCAYGPVDVMEDEAPQGTVWLAFDRAAGRLLAQGSYVAAIQVGAGGGRLHTDAELPAPRPAIGIGATPPVTAGPHVWFDITDPDVPEISVRDDGATPATSTAAVFVQPSAPAHPGPYVWIHADRLGDWAPGDPLEITIKDDGAGSAAADSDVAVSTGGAVEHALHVLDFTIDGDELEISAVYAPAEQPIGSPPPERMDDHNHLVSGPMLLETIDPWEIPDNVSDDYLAAWLPWDLSQRALSQTGPIRGSRVTAAATWVGPAFAQVRGAQAIVRTDGPLAHLVGDRIRIRHTFQGRTATVYAYVTDERDDIPEGVTAELLLTYRAFIALANPAEDFINVTVDLLA